MKPKVNDSCFVHESATIIGDVEIEEGCGIWPGAVIRGDQNRIRIGKESNVQDCCVIHVDDKNMTQIGNQVSLGHGCVVHGATIHDKVIVGMKAVVLNGAVVGQGSVIAAGALVKQGMEVPPGSLVVGVPGKVIREGDKSLEEYAERNAQTYVGLSKRHKNGEFEQF